MARNASQAQSRYYFLEEEKLACFITEMTLDKQQAMNNLRSGYQ
jgi:hypothetical protein